jgi:hypothetical protein
MASKDLETYAGDVAAVMGDLVPEPEDSELVQRKIVEQLARATTAAELFSDHSSTATKDLVGVPLKVTDCRLVESSLADSRGVYMLMEATNMITGEVILVNSGSPKVMMIIYRLRGLGMLPVEVAVKEVAPAKPGRSAPLGLEPIGETLLTIEKQRNQG